MHALRSVACRSFLADITPRDSVSGSNPRCADRGAGKSGPRAGSSSHLRVGKAAAQENSHSGSGDALPHLACPAAAQFHRRMGNPFKDPDRFRAVEATGIKGTPSTRLKVLQPLSPPPFENFRGRYPVTRPTCLQTSSTMCEWDRICGTPEHPCRSGDRERHQSVHGETFGSVTRLRVPADANRTLAPNHFAGNVPIPSVLAVSGHKRQVFRKREGNRNAQRTGTHGIELLGVPILHCVGNRLTNSTQRYLRTPPRSPPPGARPPHPVARASSGCCSGEHPPFAG